ncbi:MAG: phosphoribosyl-ATP diphosphatase [Candidatus Eisenbacteria bacterium]|uniref:Histidine biosynthesis bifunctional protein HisIE n=1 Tax=Eiseniibacteriota bacterium TaxID=2212470 RepID=A0A933W9M0_UNCEI|nr:phosphoribosyl-ATP diphosphatase [Candidatus Eisenbacteria bacterium]
MLTLDHLAPEDRVVAVAQHAVSGAVLMVAFADREALERTIATGEMHYRSRTRGLWHKGATSGNVQKVVSLAWDCDRDAVLARVLPAGPACHTGEPTCFGAAALAADAAGVTSAVVRARATDPGAEGTSYTRRLLADRNLRLKKLGEEAAELVLGCADGDRARAVSETADLVYHAIVALRALGAGWEDVQEELRQRHGE